MSTRFGSNLGLKKAMALDSLGNAYLHLRENSKGVDFNSPEWPSLIDAGRILRDAFRQVQGNFSIMNFIDKA